MFCAGCRGASRHLNDAVCYADAAARCLRCRARAAFRRALLIMPPRASRRRPTPRGHVDAQEAVLMLRQMSSAQRCARSHGVPPCRCSAIQSRVLGRCRAARLPLCQRYFVDTCQYRHGRRYDSFLPLPRLPAYMPRLPQAASALMPPRCLPPADTAIGPLFRH